MAFALQQPSRHDVYPFIDPRTTLKGAARGKCVLITGAGGGIGKGIAEAFAIAGASALVLAARRAEPLEKTKITLVELAPDCEVTVVGGVDISDSESVATLFASLSSFPDVLVSNAAVNQEWKPVAESNTDAWFETFDINLIGTYRVARAYLVNFKNAGKQEGRIINVSSANAGRYIPGLSSYAASKAGVNILSEYIERENQASGLNVRCVAMHPGGVNTGLGGEKSEEILQMLIDQPALPGGTAVYLSTERANFLMGRFVSATWDMEELEKQKEHIEGDDDMLRQRVIGVK